MDRVVKGAGRLVLGTVQWGLAYGIANTHGRPDDGEVARILARARAAGVSTLDTARAYGDSEEVIGRLTAGDRHWTIVTKLAPLTASSEVDAVREAAESVERSCTALARKHLDTLLLHRPADRTRAGGAAWRELVARWDRGEIGALGISATTPDEAFEALADPSITAMQVAFSLLDQRLGRSGFFARAKALGVTVYVRSVYLQGVAHMQADALPAHLAPLAPTLAAISAWGSARGLTTPQAFLVFAREACEGAHIVVGCETLAQYDDNVGSWALPSPGAAALDELGRLVPELSPSLLTPALWPKS